MSIDKPFRVEVTVDAPRDEVWRALTEPDRLRHWFGWEYDGLDDEIKYIVDHVTLKPPGRIEMPEDGSIELEVLGDHRTRIVVTKPGDLDAVEWQDVYGDIEEGWITFLNQLRHRIARHPGSNRRMVVHQGTVDRLPDLPGEPWHESPYQRGTDVDGELAVVFAKPTGEAMLLVSTYDLDDDAFAAAHTRWTSWWEALAR